MRDWGLTCSIFGIFGIFFGRFYAWCYGKSLGDWAHRMFLVMSKFGLVLLPVGLLLLALSVVV